MFELNTVGYSLRSKDFCAPSGNLRGFRGVATIREREQYVSVRYSERLADVRIGHSLGSQGRQL